MEKERLDIALVNRGLATTRSRAQELITRNFVMVNDKVCTKASTAVLPDTKISIIQNLKYVSRGGDKLEGALKYFSINVTGLRALDIGSSTGGFTDCLLQHGAQHVIALDVGSQQFSPSLAHDSRVTLLENTDIRNIKPEQLAYIPDIIVIDVSFISLEHIIPLLPKFSHSKTSILALIKPQFEVGKAELNKNGIVVNEEARKRVLTIIQATFELHGYIISGIIPSTITGGDGNQEYIIYVTKS